jgi:hypothetical protein
MSEILARHRHIVERPSRRIAFAWTVIYGHATDINVHRTSDSFATAAYSAAVQSAQSELPLQVDSTPLAIVVIGTIRASGVLCTTDQTGRWSHSLDSSPGGR